MLMNAQNVKAKNLDFVLNRYFSKKQSVLVEQTLPLGPKHYSFLSVELILDHGWINFQT